MSVVVIHDKSRDHDQRSTYWTLFSILQSDVCLMISIGLKSCDNTQTKDSIFIF